MNNIVNQMLKKYSIKSVQDETNALKEIKYYVKHNISDADGLLIAAKKNSNEKIVKELLKSKNIEESEKLEALWRAIDNKNIKVFDVLLKATKGENSFSNKNKETILMKACKEEKIDIVKRLIKAGANVNAQDENGITALMFACKNNNFDIAKILLGAKADVNIKDHDGYTALRYACIVENFEIVNTLITAGADVNSQDKLGSTALFSVDKNIDIVKALLAAGANVNSKLDDGFTLLMYKCKYGKDNLELVKTLIVHGAEVNAQDENGKTALMIACEKGYKDKVNALLAAGADISKKDNKNGTALCYTKDMIIRDVLVKAGANPKKEIEEYLGLNMIQIPGKNYEILSTEVTQDLYIKIMEKNPSQYKGDSLPVESVNWYDAVKFCNALSQKLGLSPVYKIYGDGKAIDWNRSADGFRLPTEEEWEYAARGGENYTYAGSNNIDEVAWYHDNSSRKSHPVGEKKPNGYGLYDMSGNVDEWCWDRGRDPTIFNDGRRIKGGSWETPADIMTVSDSGSAHVGGSRWDGKSSNGFRIVRNIK